MANFTVSPNMSLVIPTVGTDPGPDWADNLNSSLTLIDQHDHTSGNGVQITPAGLNINSDLSAQNNNFTTLRTVRFTSQSAALAGASDLGCLYEVGNDLYYNDGLGNQVRITQSGGVAGSPGSIANLTSPASASYVSADSTFVWQSAASTSANLDCASILLRNLSANSHALTLNPPAAMSANYSITLPALPGSGTKIMQMDSTGAQSATLATDSSTLEVSGSTLRVKASGITGTQIVSNVNLPGTLTTSGSQGIVVSANAATNNLIIRGEVDSAGTILVGEGYTVSRSSAGSYIILFTGSPFASTPICVVTPVAPSTIAQIADINTAGVNVGTQTLSAGTFHLADSSFHFIAIGPRA